MLTCPLCKKDVAEPQRTCPRCQADLSLLADLMSDVQTLLTRAESHRKAGEIAPAVQAYLTALDVDPTNTEARAAVGPVLLAVRSAARIDPSRASASLAATIVTLVVAIVAVAVGFALSRLMI